MHTYREIFYALNSSQSLKMTDCVAQRKRNGSGWSVRRLTSRLVRLLACRRRSDELTGQRFASRTNTTTFETYILSIFFARKKSGMKEGKKNGERSFQMHLPRWQFLANKCPYAKRRKHFSKQFAFATWNEKIIEIPAEMFLHSSKHLKVRTTAMKNRTILSKRTRLKRHFWFVDEKLWVLSSGLRKVSNEIQWTIRWYETVSFVRISFSLFFSVDEGRN